MQRTATRSPHAVSGPGYAVLLAGLAVALVLSVAFAIGTGTVEVPESVRRATFPVRVETAQLADGVYLLGGTTHNSIAIEFKDYVAVVEAPLDEARSLAVIEEVVKLVPAKPIRFLVNTHQHHDHIGQAEGNGLQLHPSRLDLRKVQQIAEQGEQAVGRFANRAQVIALLRR